MQRLHYPGTIYPHIRFPKAKVNFYTSFVSTIDGKIYVDKPGYWPIGSDNDYAVFTWLRAHADLIIDGKNTALKFADRTIETIHRDDFLDYRKRLGITRAVQYGILSRNPQGLDTVIQNSFSYKPILFTGKNTPIVPELNSLTKIVRFEAEERGEFIQDFVNYCRQNGIERVFVDGGAQLLVSLLQEKLLDDIFYTIGPKIYGNEEHAAVTMAEGYLFPSEETPKFEVRSLKNIDNEIYIHYKRIE